MSFRIKERGFTLIELMVTIAIIAILAAVGMVMYSTAQKAGRVSKRIQDLKAIQIALESFKGATGKYPSVITAGAFVCLDTLTSTNSLVPDHMPVIPKDPLGTGYCYRYTSDGTAATLAGPPAGNNYKVMTDPSLTSAEMGYVVYQQQAALIDPDRDGTADDSCTVTTTGAAQTAWAVYTSSAASCNW